MAAEILSHMVSTFTEVEQKVLKPLFSDNEGLIGADDLLPMTIFVTIKSRCALYRIKIGFDLCNVVFHCLGLFYTIYMTAFEWHEDGGDNTVTDYEVGMALFNSITMVIIIK